MKRKILLSLFTLFTLFALGAFVANLNVMKTTATFNRLIKLHQIEDLRNGLLKKILIVQSNLYVVNTPQAEDLNLIVENVSSLEASADRCLTCHHEADVKAALTETGSLIQNYKRALSFYMTASADKERIEALKRETSFIGNKIIANTEKMAFVAGKKIELMTVETLAKVEKANQSILLSLSIAFIFGVFVAIYLTRSVTGPIRDLVGATRKIAEGELGYRLPREYKAEFGELADNLNGMSMALKKSYNTLQEEIVERKQTEEALQVSEERYALAALAANDGLWDWNLKTDVMYFSPRWKLLLGFGESDIGDSFEDWLTLVHPEDQVQLKTKLFAHIDGHISYFEDEYRIRHKDGSYRWMLSKGIAVRELSEKAYRIAGSQTDITEQKATQDQLVYDALHDALTGLPNRALFIDRLKSAINRVQRHPDYLYAVLFLDLDRFKLVNDSLGHQVGDQLLIAVSKRLFGFLRPTDTIARLGGDEFAILLEDLNNYSDAIHIAQRIVKELPLPFDVSGRETFTTASIGVALSNKDYEQPGQLLRDADLAMYHAKANGKAHYEIFHETMHLDVINRLRLETDLRKAIDNHEFRLHYQPIFSLAENRVTGFEALVRWKPLGQDLVSPLDFIPLAEETGLIKEIGQWVINAACRKARDWCHQLPAEPALTININISSKEFTPDLREKLLATFTALNIEPSIVRLELTESIIMEDPEMAAQLLVELKEMGVGLLVDDFGTGYSSLSYLQQFPFDALKIDRSFVKNVHLDKEKFEIVKTIVDLAHNLRMEIIAEGVETTGEFNVMADLGCEYIQGFYFSKPLDEVSVEKFILAEVNNRKPIELKVRQ